MYKQTYSAVYSQLDGKSGCGGGRAASNHRSRHTACPEVESGFHTWMDMKRIAQVEVPVTSP